MSTWAAVHTTYTPKLPTHPIYSNGLRRQWEDLPTRRPNVVDVVVVVVVVRWWWWRRWCRFRRSVATAASDHYRQCQMVMVADCVGNDYGAGDPRGTVRKREAINCIQASHILYTPHAIPHFVHMYIMFSNQPFLKYCLTQTHFHEATILYSPAILSPLCIRVPDERWYVSKRIANGLDRLGFVSKCWPKLKSTKILQPHLWRWKHIIYKVVQKIHLIFRAMGLAHEIHFYGFI